MNLNQVGELAKQQLMAVTGLEPITVIGMAHDDGGWKVTVELLEVRRIPHATSLIGAYEAVLDDEGNLIGFRRTRQRRFGEAEERSAA